jgi:hypothetical protein
MMLSLGARSDKIADIAVELNNSLTKNEGGVATA